MNYVALLRVGVLLTGCAVAPIVGCAQPVWENLELPVPLGTSFALFADSVDDALYVGGNYSLDGDTQLGDNALFRYQNGHWDTLPGLSDQVSCVIRYGDSLLVAGGMYYINGDTLYPIVRWDGITWQPFGYFSDGVVQRLRILNGELYAVGSFASADGHVCNGVAKRQGGSWVNVGLPQFAYSELGVHDIALYEDQLVITGTMNAVGSTSRDIMAYDGQEWYKLCEPSLLGVIAGGGALIEYQGDLYVTGVILRSSGNVGQNIQRWDGVQWHDLDEGLTPEPGYTGFWGTGEQLLVHDGLLWVGGGFYYAGNTPAWSIATWDGHHWCGLGAELNPTSYDFTFFRDTLYATTPIPFSATQNVHDVARYIGTGYADTCGLAVGLPDQLGMSSLLTAVQTPDGILVQGLPPGQHELTLQDALGRVVAREEVRNSVGEGMLLKTPANRATGLYILNVDGKDFVKLWVSER